MTIPSSGKRALEEFIQSAKRQIMKEAQKELIIKLVNSPSDMTTDSLRAKIRDTFPALFKVKKGTLLTPIESKSYLVRFDHYTGNTTFTSSEIFGKVANHYKWVVDSFREATDEEIEQILIEEAKRRGFKEGVKVKYVNAEVRLLGKFSMEDDQLAMGANWIYDPTRGWAEIVEEPKTKKVALYACQHPDGNWFRITRYYKSHAEFQKSNPHLSNFKRLPETEIEVPI